ncbi:hypothetical protein TOT_040000137 [Theileria orientalis strain Shintoku]|uniref:Uncharacterized protein n=1 Tax=Theileria orientalis strain Shintoku TaxID=869250 RepID=J4DA35_THEOR|nr:hypothetical protein TOT_040000137 [Theileria orientalis strain Shintoku]PVC53650.1 hypothetical protein MACL_00003665 [Theileria orientalis]BAM41755.1 hypothetical protein TOT_040000137 [Theileria orientalis strain Shintoku]|eukprot:XP_009692056.1 hypothetical protein TOT_040000137 [Theileria orientalis strain Shintoku]
MPIRCFENKFDLINILSLKCQNCILTHVTHLGNNGSQYKHQNHKTQNIIYQPKPTV